MYKQLKNYVGVGLLTIGLLTLGSCGGSKSSTKVTPPNDEVEVNVLCSGPEYQSHDIVLNKRLSELHFQSASRQS